MRSTITLHRLLVLGLGVSLFLALAPINATRADGYYEYGGEDGGGDAGKDDPNSNQDGDAEYSWGSGGAGVIGSANAWASFSYGSGSASFSSNASACFAVCLYWVADPEHPEEIPPGGTVSRPGAGRSARIP